jgi:hypothetical protein
VQVLLCEIEIEISCATHHSQHGVADEQPDLLPSMWKGKLNKKIVVAAHFRFVHCLLFFHSLGLVDATLIPMEDQWGFLCG